MRSKYGTTASSTKLSYNCYVNINIALVVADTAGKWPYREDVTADFMYLRLHGDKELYASGYTDEALIRWAERIRVWREGSQPDDAHLISTNLHTPTSSSGRLLLL